MKVVLCRKNIKAWKCLQYSVKMTLDFTAHPSHKSWVWMAVEQSQLGHCSKVSETAFKVLSCLRAVPPILFCHVLPPFAIQALNFISFICICSILVACISVILIFQVLCLCPDICIGQQLQHWQDLKI